MKRLNKGAVMKNTNYQLTMQSLKDAKSQIQEMVEGRMRTAILDMVYELFEQELLGLCGPKYNRDKSYECERAGSDPGSVLAQGQRVKVKKPRAKKDGKDIELQSYSALRQYDLLCDRVKEHAARSIY